MGDWEDEVTKEDSVFAAAKHAPARRKRVLLVDDSEAARMAERMAPGRDPYDLIIARNGVEAVERALAERPDLILLDVMMPQRSGFDVCRELRRHEATRDTPIILVTARSEGEHVGAGPFTAADVLARLRSHLGQ